MTTDDKMKLTRVKLPGDVRQTVERLTKDLDQKSRASIDRRLDGTFAKIERKDIEKK